MKRKTIKKRASAKHKMVALDWVALLERESRETAKPVEQLLAEKAGAHHPELLKLAGPPWGAETELVTFNVTGPELLALKHFVKERFNKDTKLSTAAYFILASALANPDLINNWFEMVVGYELEEGLDQRTFMRSRIWACEEYHKKADDADGDDAAEAWKSD